MKKILGIDLGTTSIGWAFVKEAQNENEQSSIEKMGVRIIQYDTFSKVDKSGKVSESKNPEQDFASGRGLSPNADRTLKRGARRNLQRYKQRRENLLNALKQNGIINEETILAENDKDTTHNTYALRAKAASEEITKEQFACVLLMINKKRGYKSSRKANNEDQGQAIDGMAIAKRLYEENLTPGQLCYQLLKEEKKHLPDFYRSDLQAEFEKIWNFQKQFYSEILTNELHTALQSKNKTQTWAICKEPFQIVGIKRETKGLNQKIENYEWRGKALSEQIVLEELAIALQEINNNINSSSGYLGAISDRSKELYFNRETVGQYLFKQLQVSPHTRMKNQVFYRQDYFDEFETIWETQAKFHEELTPALKEEIRDIIIFFQRKLKSQKGLVSFCEFESKEIKLEKDGKTVSKIIGYKVAPKSSHLFQEFKIWQNLNSLLKQKKETKEVAPYDEEDKQMLFEELNIKGNLSKDALLTILGYKPKEWELNFTTIEGNRTNQALYAAYFKMMELEGHEEIEWQGLSANEIKSTIKSFFQSQNIDTAILDFDAELEGKAFEQQASYQLWHLLYAYEGDNSPSGNDDLYKLLLKKFGFKKEFAQILANVNLQQDYGSLSAKAMKKILPYLKAGHPFAKKDNEDKIASATALAGYNHSSSLTKEENENREFKEKLELLPKNSLRNPVVEKILNQMVNVVNAIIADPTLGKPDEIRIELARELKKNAKEREEMTTQINKANIEHDRIREVLIKEDGIKNPTRNDIIRYKLYQELKINGYKTLYSDTYIPREKLFSKEFDIEHIIPKALLFDDSFSNKTLCVRKENLDKGNVCARNFIGSYFGEHALPDYVARVEMMHKSKEGAISKAKYKKLLMMTEEIGTGFIERDLRDSQYIAKKAKEMLHEVCRTIVSTTGSVTDQLREDWDLINLMQELNIDKYRKLGLTEMIEKKDGGLKERIIGWTKRNDHRHHAMDALTVAFTKHSHIQYLNNLNARKKEDKLGREIYGIEQKETYLFGVNGTRKRKFKSPLTNFRDEAKKHLENVLISFKAKNKVVTKNKNKSKSGKGDRVKIELTPRGQLHKETVYGKLKQYATKLEKISVKFDEKTISKVASAKYRDALLKRLKENNNDPKAAFTGKNNPEKNPVYLDGSKSDAVPEKVKIVWYEDDYTIRKDVTPENFKDAKNIEKVIDVGIRTILQKRLEEYKGNGKEAFSNLDKNPIWQNEEKGIAIKRVTISGVKNAEPLHTKKDHLGKDILDENDKKIPVDFVSTGNNHHVAIYRDADGNLQEKVVSLYEAVERVNQGLLVIDKVFNQDLGWQFLFTMKQNEYFVFPSDGFDPSEIDLLKPTNNKLLSQNLYRVQKFTIRDYFFRHHFETNVENHVKTKNTTWRREGLGGIEGMIKIRINHIGQIVKVGEH
ncbi:MAG TPA: type II CRISPR RNA-guided endonuclease Cas9 [Chitinophagaceae bacterium]|nr:type II CRISPR RNA-guided endonuclease Cas9 [Chitinophagaceae bacterium]